MKKGVLVVGVLICLFALFVWGLGDSLFPLMFSFALAYLLFPLIKKMEMGGVKRTYAVFGAFASITVIVITSFILILPGLVDDGTSFFKELPGTSAKAIDKIEIVSSSFGYNLDLSKQGVKNIIKSHVSDVSTSMLKTFSKTLSMTFKNILGWILAVLNIFLIPLFFFYVINDYELITLEIKSYIPKSILPKVSTYSSLCNTVLSGYIRGQLMVALVLGILYGVGLWIVGLKFGFFIGFIAGLISVIPYAGFAFGFVAAITVSLANYSGFGTLSGIVAVFVVVQALEGFLITPKLVGNKVGLSSFATLLALIIGGNILGVTGMLLAIPLAAIAKSVIKELKKEYRSSVFFG